VDDRTLDAYARETAEFSRRHRGAGGVLARVPEPFPAGARVLDVGAGIGRDLAALLAAGYAAFGVEPVAEMRAEAVRLHPELAGRLFEGTLPDGLPALDALGGPFDGVLSSAVLQHLPRADLPAAVAALGGLLRAGGRALISVRVWRPDLDETTGRDPFGRLFNGLSADELQALFEAAGFRTLARSEDADPDARDRVRWAALLFERESDAAGAGRGPASP
jgi:SAM-dependent methyltransferase